MRTSDFDYPLPRDLIAQRPIEPRDHSRLLVLDRGSGEILHRRFYQLPDHLVPGGVGPMTVAMLLVNTLKAAQTIAEG